MKILVLPGDGIGPEITQATLTVLDRVSAKFQLGLEWDKRDMGMVTLKQQGTTLPESVMEAALQKPETRTADLGGKLGTQAFAAAIAQRIG